MFVKKSSFSIFFLLFSVCAVFAQGDIPNTPTPTVTPMPQPALLASSSLIDLNGSNLAENQLVADPPSGFRFGKISFGAIPDGFYTDGKGMAVRVSPGEGIWIVVNVAMEAPSLAVISGAFRSSSKDVSIALIALNCPVDGQLGYTNITGEEIPVEQYRSLNLIYRPPSGWLQIAVQIVNYPYSSLTSTVYVDNLSVKPLAPSISNLSVGLEVDGSFEKGVDKLISNINDDDGRITPFFESLSDIAIRLSIEPENSAANVGTIVQDVENSFPMTLVGEVNIYRETPPSDGMLAFVLANGFQSLCVYRFAKDIPDAKSKEPEYLIIGGDFTVNNPSVPIHAIVQNGGPNVSSSVVVDDLVVKNWGLINPTPTPTATPTPTVTPTPPVTPTPTLYPGEIIVPLNLPEGAIPLYMEYIPAGTFFMGSPPNEMDRQDNEGPQHQVTITKPLYFGKYEVTQAQWQAVMGNNPSLDSGVGPNYPVYNVSWNDCQIYIQKLNQMGIGTFRLPTEAEWEYACRAGTYTRFYWGDDLNFTQIKDYAWYDGNDGTKEVGLKLPNSFGLYDMSGNVREWCQDWLGVYSINAQNDPIGVSNDMTRASRGGNWSAHLRDCRSAFRNSRASDDRDGTQGFRIAASSQNLPPALTPTPTITATPISPAEEITIPLDYPKNTILLPMKLIPAGTFMMGSPESEAGRSSNEGPQHQVTITNPFYMGKYEVTQTQWQAVMGSNPSYNPIEDNNLPVERVSWNDCQTFIQKLNALGQGTFRLPTEAEWEYACRGGTTTRFYWGDDTSYSQIGNYAWYNGNSGGETHGVGAKLPNAWGLYDMSGNVGEWCRDWIGSYSSNAQIDPIGAKGGNYIVCRGGSVGGNNYKCRSAHRGENYPDTRDGGLGLRLARNQ
ncbi:MAG: formylglycine-generating enzyme family protein [Candidatus Omnitrophota bacterium]